MHVVVDLDIRSENDFALVRGSCRKSLYTASYARCKRCPRSINPPPQIERKADQTGFSPQQLGTDKPPAQLYFLANRVFVLNRHTDE